MAMLEQEAYAVAGKGAAIAKSRSPLHDVSEAFDLAHELAARAENLAGRLVGEVPEDASVAARALLECGGVLGATAETASRVKAHIVSALRALDRVEAQLP